MRVLTRWPLLIPCALAVACSQAPDPSSQGGPAAPASPARISTTVNVPPAKPAPAGPADGEEHLSSVVAEVNGRPLYRAFYEQSLNFIRDRLPAGQDAATLERYINAKFEALDRIIDDELLYQQAQKEGMTVSNDEVQAEFQRVATTAGGEGRFLSVMRQQSVSRYDAIEGIRRRLTVNKYIRERLSAGMTATDEEMLNYYNSNLDRFTPEVWVKLFQIAILCPRGAHPDQAARAQQRASKLLGEIRAGKPFEAIARGYSEDKSGPIGGNMGFVRRGASYPEFDAVMFSMKPGETSEVIRTDDGFHILRIAERRGGAPKPFDAVREDCRKALLSQKQADAVRRIASQLRESASITTYID